MEMESSSEEATSSNGSTILCIDVCFFFCLFSGRVSVRVVVAITRGGKRKSSLRIAHLDFLHGRDVFAAREWNC